MDNSMNEHRVLKCMKILVPVVGIGIVLTIVTFAIAVTTLVKVNQGFDDIQTNGLRTTPSQTTTTTNPRTTTTTPTGQPVTTTTTTATTTTVTPSASTTTTGSLLNATLSQVIQIQDVTDHLNELQRIATGADGNRAIHTIGFNQTLEYIINTLNTKTNYNVTTTFFLVRAFELGNDPTFSVSINNTVTDYNYSSDLSKSEFAVGRYSRSVNLQDYVELVVIPNEGCTDADWKPANSSVDGKVALVKRGNCTYIEKAALATTYNATAILIYNHGVSTDSTRPSSFNLGQENEIPALSLSYDLGQQLVNAAANSANIITVNLSISIVDETPKPVGNICADTRTGDPTQTIVVGSHSDSVPEGPGINDNGSGSAANLALAIALARLLNTSTYTPYEYRIRFCWWGAEEVGLLGSRDHVKQAKNATAVGERLRDYLINLNFDMLASPNFIFGIYDDKTASNDTPVHALPGSERVSDLFRYWFESQGLPWSNTDFSGRSDYGPFLAEGIVAGGLFTGAEKNKSKAEYDYYEQMLGQGFGGSADAPYDSCYHKACDSIQNVNSFAYEKMVQAAANALEYLARQDNLTAWLYPDGRPTRSQDDTPSRQYDSINEFFELPYF